MACADRHSEYLRRKERGVVYRHHAARECVRCGQTYQPTGPGQKYCSAACKPRREAQVCEGCGGEYVPRHGRRPRFCSRDCYLQRGARQPIIRSDGYVRIWVPKGTPGRSHGRMLEHRYVMQQALGRALTDKDAVHHLNGDRTDNRIENLQLVGTFHGKGAILRCRCCGSEDVEAVELPEVSA